MGEELFHGKAGEFFGHHNAVLGSWQLEHRRSHSSRLYCVTLTQNVREQIEQRELASLSSYAAKAAESAGRLRRVTQDPLRTCFQRDRDRILHSKAFRRLKHKTQVFIAPVGDHYRTRLTHTLEVSQIARTIGRALRLNEDLIEAVALGHDVGHTPFGHAGEQALDDAVRALGHPTITRFRHYEQSLRIVDVLEDLNLTEETRKGIDGHSKGAKDLTASDGMPTSTLEAAVVRVSDRIAYLSHDIDDAIRAGVIVGLPSQFDWLGKNQSDRIKTMVLDVVKNSLDRPAIELSPRLLDGMNELKDWMFSNVYFNEQVVLPETRRAQEIVKELFGHFVEPGALPEGYEGVQGAIDYIAGMTDRFAIESFERLRIPKGFRSL
ncbi:MAG: deoxyguanosinetriphosphate triphosphohydrolase [Armatimonadetes bacterium]|nr:deoxyguanosinetriphosphate triphosphohydrolase [Armatimonadota bacterium]